MVKIKEIKISIHRKYTKDCQSYGYRIGVMLDIGKDDPRGSYYEGKAFLNERIKEEDLVIKNIMDKRVAEKQSGYKELGVIPKKKVGVIPEKVTVSKENGGDELILIDVRQIVNVTSKAVFVELFDGRKVWIPKSCVEGGDEIGDLARGEKTMLEVKEWFLIKEKIFGV